MKTPDNFERWLANATIGTAERQATPAPTLDELYDWVDQLVKEVLEDPSVPRPCELPHTPRWW